MSSEVLQKINLIYVVLNQYLNESTEKGVLSINKSLLVLTKKTYLNNISNKKVLHMNHFL